MSNGILKTLLASLTATLIWPMTVTAAELSYDYAEASYVVDSELDAFVPGVGSRVVDGDGFDIAGSVLVAPSFVLDGGYTTLGLDNDVDADRLQIGAAYRLAMTDAVDVLLGAAYDDVEIENPLQDVDDNGIRPLAGIRARIADSVELNGEAGLPQYDESDGTDLRLGGLVDVTPAVAVTFGYEWLSLEDDNDREYDIEQLKVGVRYNF